jgi:hypothetical protein
VVTPFEWFRHSVVRWGSPLRRRQGEVEGVLFIAIILYAAAIVAVAHALARE